MEGKKSKLFSGIFSMVYVDIWFEPGFDQVPKKKKVNYGVSTHMFYAENSNEAFGIAKKMMEGFVEATCDAESDLLQMYCQGLIDIQEVFIPSDSTLDKTLRDYYGLDVGGIYDISKCVGGNIDLKARAINENVWFKA